MLASCLATEMDPRALRLAEYITSAGLLALWCTFEVFYSRVKVLSLGTPGLLLWLTLLLIGLSLTALLGVLLHGVMLLAEQDPAGLTFALGSALLLTLARRPFSFLFDFPKLRMIKNLVAVETIRYGRPDPADAAHTHPVFVISKRHQLDPRDSWKEFPPARPGATGKGYRELAFDIERRVSALTQTEWENVISGYRNGASLRMCVAMLFADLMPSAILNHADAPPLFQRLRRVKAGCTGRNGMLVARKLGLQAWPAWETSTAAGSGETWNLLVLTAVEYLHNVPAAVREHERMVRLCQVGQPLDYLKAILEVLKPADTKM